MKNAIRSLLTLILVLSLVFSATSCDLVNGLGDDVKSFVGSIVDKITGSTDNNNDGDATGEPEDTENGDEVGKRLPIRNLILSLSPNRSPSLSRAVYSIFLTRRILSRPTRTLTSIRTSFTPTTPPL